MYMLLPVTLILFDGKIYIVLFVYFSFKRLGNQLYDEMDQASLIPHHIADNLPGSFLHS